eukprot:m.83737 g.83737  ORF g.83737 m.83737 type:complete len:332 (-) comp14989_c0_seq1:592-1587(-)
MASDAGRMATKADFEQIMRENALDAMAQQSGLLPPMTQAAMHHPQMHHQSSGPGSAKRVRHDSPASTPDDDVRRRGGAASSSKAAAAAAAASTDKNGKGLRHFSMKVCQKVKEKGITSYNEVADELVQEQQMADEMQPDLDDDQPHGPKNIRRRVYDALNVLMAMNIISKEKKEIRWIGLPSSSIQELSALEEAKAKRMESIAKKKAHLQELILQQIAFKNLVKRNARLTSEGKADPANSIHLPFIIVNTNKQTVIDCQMAENKSEYFFDFNMPFEIHDDIEVLKRMGMAFDLENGCCTDEQLEEARSMIPQALSQYLSEMRKSAPSGNRA